MLPRSLSRLVVIGVVAAVPLSRAHGQVDSRPGTSELDPVFVRAQQMVMAGQDAAGRAVIDSVVAATAPGTAQHAEALYWRATLSQTAAAAERDYRTLAVEYPLSPRAGEALLRLAQLELTRRDRASARAHLERLQREHPGMPASVRGSVLLARLAFEDGDLATACGAVAAAREGVAPGDVETRNQLDYVGGRCDTLVPAAASADSTMPAPAVNPAPPRPGVSAREFSVQVAAYDTKADASALAKRLSSRGFAVRVVGEQKPYRVRIGRYPTRARADDAARQMARVNVRGFVVEAEPK